MKLQSVKLCGSDFITEISEDPIKHLDIFSALLLYCVNRSVLMPLELMILFVIRYVCSVMMKICLQEHLNENCEQ